MKFKRALPLLAAVTILCPVAAYGAEPVSQVHDMTGRANVLRSATRQVIPATLKMPLYLQDVVRTGARSKMNLLFVDDSMVSIGRHTRLVITTYLYDPHKRGRRSIIDLTWGSLKCVTSSLVRHKDTQFTVRTPTSVVGVRGSVFVVSFDYHRRLTEVVNQSRVSPVRVTLRADPARTVVLAPGEMVHATRLKIGPKRPIPPQYRAVLADRFLPVQGVRPPQRDGWTQAPDVRPPSPGPWQPMPVPGPIRPQCPPGTGWHPGLRRCIAPHQPAPGPGPELHRRCPRGQYWNLRLRRCRPLRCRPGHVLRHGRCIRYACPPGTRRWGARCVPIKCPPGQVLRHGRCVRYACPPGTRRWGRRCVPIRCRPGFVRRHGRCVRRPCPRGHVWDGRRCRPLYRRIK